MHWYHTFEIIECGTPSRNDEIDFETESRYRKEGARFIMELGNKLGLRYLTMATGIVFYHRFYMFHSFKAFSRWVTGATCLFLAGKVEETPKKCKDILKYAQQMLTDSQFKTFGENPREELMILERILLQTIKFDLQTAHPYEFLIKYGKSLKGDKSKINEFVQKAWIFINDSLSTPLCLVYQPEIIALAVLLLAFKMSNQDIREFMHKSRVEWWKSFHSEATENDLEEICKDLMNLYEGKPPRRRFPFKHLAAKKEKSIESAGNSPMLASNASPKTPNSPLSKRKKKLPSSSIENTPTSMKSNSSDESSKPSNENETSKENHNSIKDSTSVDQNISAIDNTTPPEDLSSEASLKTDTQSSKEVDQATSRSPAVGIIQNDLESENNQANNPGEMSNKTNSNNILTTTSDTLSTKSHVDDLVTAKTEPNTKNILQNNPVPLMSIGSVEPQLLSYNDQQHNSPIRLTSLSSNENIGNEPIHQPAVIPDVRETMNTHLLYQQKTSYVQFAPNTTTTPQSIPNLPMLMHQQVQSNMGQPSQEEYPPLLSQMPMQQTNIIATKIEDQQLYNRQQLVNSAEIQGPKQGENYLPRGIQRVPSHTQNAPPPPILDHMSSFFQSNQAFSNTKKPEPQRPSQLQISQNVPQRPNMQQRAMLNQHAEQSPTHQPPFSPYQAQPPHGVPQMHQPQVYFQHQGSQQQQPFMHTPPHRGVFNDPRMQNRPQSFENFAQMLSHQQRHPRGPNMNMRPPFPSQFQGGGPWI